MRENLNSTIWHLTWPNVLSNITVPLLGMADVAIAGFAGGDTMIGGVSVGSTVFNFIYMNCAFLRVGTTGMTAQAFGARNISEAKHILARAISVALLIALVLVLFKLPIASCVVSLMGGSADVMEMVRRYMTIRMWAIPAALPLFAFNGWFIGMQDARTPLLVSVCANVVNIALSYLFTIRLSMGIEGIALGTVLAQYVSLALFLWRLSRRHHVFSHSSSILLSKLRLAISRDKMTAFFKVNADVFVRNFCITLAYTVFTRTSANISDTILATDALLMQLFTLFAYMFDGCAFAAESLSGRFIGARSGHLFRKACRLLFIWGSAISLFYMVLYIILWQPILLLFNPSPEVLLCSTSFIGYVIAVPLVACIPYMTDGILFGATYVRPLTIFSAISVIIFILSDILLTPLYGNHGLWLSFLLFTLLRGLLLLRPLRSLYRNPLKASFFQPS